MIPFEEIDIRLAGIEKNRAWLAQVTGRSEGSIRAALAPNSTPKNRTSLLQKALSDAIEREESTRASIPPGYTEIFMNDEEINLADRASRVINSPSLAAFCHDVIQAEARKILRGRGIDNNPTVPFRGAEDPTIYTPRAHIQAAAGLPLSAEVQDWDGDDDIVRVKIHGLSMSPKMNDGDLIEMRHKRASRNPYMKKGLIYLVEYDGGYTVKRYNTRPATTEEKGEEWVEAGKVKVLESINPAFPEIIIKQPLEWIAWLDESPL